MISLIFLILALVLFLICAAVPLPAPPDSLRSRLVSLGLACWVISELMRVAASSGVVR